MKTVFTILFLLMFATVGYGQARLGSTASEIRAEFSESSYNLKTGYTDEEVYYIEIETENATVVYYFDKEKVCRFCIVVPDNQGALNFYVESYNEQYVIVSDTKWKMYSEGGIAEVELIIEDDTFYFAWSN